MSSTEPPFRSVAIVGLGLIGGSIALAVRERWPSARISGVDRQARAGARAWAAAPSTAAADNASDGCRRRPDHPGRAGAPEPEAACRNCAARSGHRHRHRRRRHEARHRATRRARWWACSSFVGGHPIGGAERGGFGFARPDLFNHRPWIFTPTPATPTAALDRLFEFARGLGAKPSRMDAAEHDRVMAFLSHLPQLAASALMDVVGSSAGEAGLRLAGRGLVDTTRLASSPPDIWRDICATNADAIGEALDVLIDRLSDLRADLRSGEAVNRIFTEAARWRTELMSGRE